MKLLLKAVKDKITATGNLSSLVGRVYMAMAPENVKVSDGPYCRVSVVGNQGEYAFADTVAVDTTQLQFSVFASALNVADDLSDKLIAALGKGARLTMDNGSVASGTRRSRGMLVESPKGGDGIKVFHSFTVIEFVYDEQ